MLYFHRFLNSLLIKLGLKHPWTPPAGYYADKLRDFKEPMVDDGTCNLCGLEEEECPCFKY